ncbi:DUF4604 domain-containing protein [Sporobolomyces salmoneus]|uniref:DUF4604 domain-containing protein n=1 Tax=Sporobolomyces salmoneus TaxID=183962 RepID=UPI003178560E
MSKRSRDPRDDPKSGPSKNQLRGLSYDHGKKPAFLQNALSALQGGTGPPKREQPQFDANGRPTIPTRPGEGSEGEEEEEDEDEWDLGGGDEAPTVVVLKEGKHLDKDEVNRLRAQGSTIAESTEPESTKAKGSLSFSSGPGAKSKGKKEAGPKETWDEVVKRSKNDAETKQIDKEQQAVDAAKQKEKDEKRKKKEKKEAKKKIGMLSFEEE